MSAEREVLEADVIGDEEECVPPRLLDLTSRAPLPPRGRSRIMTSRRGVGGASQASLHSPLKVTGRGGRLTRVHGLMQGDATEDRAMSQTTDVLLGSIGSLWRYPVKSMMGEELNAAEVTERGLRGDRAYALVDRADGKVASAKNPRKWPSLFDFRATFIEPPSRGANLPPVRIVLPDGTIVSSAQRDVDQVLSRALHREVTLEAIAGGDVGATSSSGNPRTANAEVNWPDLEGLDYRDTVTDFEMPVCTFFDIAVVHLLTTATLDRLGEVYPQRRFEGQRFRPHIVVVPASGGRASVVKARVGLQPAVEG